jgi:hypothetical protein
MVREKMEMLENYVNTTDPIHFMACMTVYEKDIPVLRDTLKPHRAFVVE